MATNQLDFRVKNGLVVGGAVAATGLTVDTDTLVVDATNNRVGISTASPTAKLHVTGANKIGGILVESSSTSVVSPSIEVIGKRSDANNSSAFAGKILLGANRTDAAVATNKRLGAVAFGGNHTDGLLTNLLYTASISGIAEGTFADANTMPTGLAFFTGAVGTTSESTTVAMGTERMRIDSTGQTKFSYNTVVEVTDNTNAALRITQLGTGNALLVEDSANPDSSPFLIDAAGRNIQGYTSSITGAGGLAANSQIASTGSAASRQGFVYSATTTAASVNEMAKSASATVGTQAVVASGETLGVVRFSGSDGTNFLRAAEIGGFVDGTPGTNDMPGRLVFSTTAEGASSPTERMRIDSAGRLRQFGTTIVSNVDVLNATYDNVFKSVTTQQTTPTEVFFSPDGYKMFIVGSGGDNVNQYNLSVAWAVSSASHSAVFALGQGEASPQGLFFRADGLKMYIAGNTLDSVLQYALTSPWNVTTATYESKFFSVATQELSITSVFFKPDGVSMYVIGNGSDGVYQYTLSTPWDVTTATYLQAFSVAGQEGNPQAVTFTGDGTRMFVMGAIGNDINVYNLTTPWDISTASFVNSFSVAAQETAPTGLYIKPDGTKMYVVGSTNDTVFQYTVPSVEIELTGTTSINGSATVAQDFTVNGNFVGYGSINGMTVGEFGSYNTVVGNLSLRKNISGSSNTAIGSEVLMNSTTASNNIAVGSGALRSNTTASNNTAVGYQAGYSYTTSGYITAIGYRAGYLSNAGGMTAIGANVLYNNTGSGNVGVGGEYFTVSNAALYANTSGTLNTAIGVGALASNTTANNNTAVGYQAGYSNTTGTGNTANGVNALYSNTTGSNNVANGVNALLSNTTGYSNVANGVNALRSNTTGNYNTANGMEALYSNTTGYYNTANGVNALLSNTTGYSNVANGVNALHSNTTGYSNTANGVSALHSNTTGYYNTANGMSALLSNTTGNYNTANGMSALLSNTTGYYNTANGVNALRSNTTGYYNTANGRDALYSNTTGNYNTANGVGALYSNTTGTGNTANGTSALYSNTTGSNNTANGMSALLSNTTGYSNVANGVNALYSNTTGYSNTANGRDALYSNTTGAGNTANGTSALYSNTTANTNTAVGYQAGYSNTTGTGNTANGVNALYSNTTGSNNTANGTSALYSNTTGYSNVANGTSALYSNTTGYYNTANGVDALRSNTTGYYNTANGRDALYSNTTGNYNTANGVDALLSNTTGYYNTANGEQALRSNTTGSNNVANGVNALYSNTTANNNVANGRDALYSNTTGTGNTANGTSALYSNTTGNYNVANGVNALLSNTTGYNNTANGVNALYSNTTGYNNVANGRDALYSNTTGYYNTANGVNALLSNTTGSNNTANGVDALRSNTTGSNNTANGVSALYSNTTANNNVANGVNALRSNTTGYYNTANGTSALYSNTTGSNNTANGVDALFSNTTGNSNTALGANAGAGITTGPYNTCVGYFTGNALTTGAGNTFVGSFQSGGTAGAGSAVTTGSKNVILGGYTGSAAPISATGSNYIVLSDGDGQIRGIFDSSGNFVAGATAAGNLDNNAFWISPVSAAGYFGQNHVSGTASGREYAFFAYAGTSIGSITQSGTTAVLYNVTSDQRLKENIQDAESSSSLIDSLQVRKFDWKTDQTHQRYGFIAQELVTVYPEAVHQPEDTEQMMAVDYSKLVPMLVKEIQSLRKRLAAAGIA